MVIKRKAAIKPKKYTSPIAIPPGVTIKELADEAGITQIELATRMDISTKHLSKLINGEVELTRDIARILEVIFGLDVSFWMNLENSYRERLYELAPVEISDEELEIARSIPYNDLVKMKLVPATRKIEEKVLCLRKFFATVNLLQIPKLNVAYRKANICKEEPYALSAWIRIAEIQAQKIEVNKFNKKELVKMIPEFRSMTMQEPGIFFPKLQEMCASVGIALVVANHISGTGVNGVTFLNSKKNKIIMQLSVRRKVADAFWFTFFHEISHIMSSTIEELTYIDCDEETEIEMDKMARNFLIDDEMYYEFVQSGNWSTWLGIQRFSERVGIHPCIVIGRLKFDKFIPYSQYATVAPKFVITSGEQ